MKITIEHDDLSVIEAILGAISASLNDFRFQKIMKTDPIDMPPRRAVLDDDDDDEPESPREEPEAKADEWPKFQIFTNKDLGILVVYLRPGSGEEFMSKYTGSWSHFNDYQYGDGSNRIDITRAQADEMFGADVVASCPGLEPQADPDPDPFPHYYKSDGGTICRYWSNDTDELGEELFKSGNILKEARPAWRSIGNAHRITRERAIKVVGETAVNMPRLEA